MKNIFLKISFVFAICLLVFSNVNAQETKLESLGGIHLNDSFQYVKKIYGEPKKIEEREFTSRHDVNSKYKIITLYYNNFRIYIFNDKVKYIVSCGRNGIKTSKGIQVGDSEQDLLKIYNLPVEDNIYVLIQPMGEINELYTCFKIQNGKIIRIHINEQANWDLLEKILDLEEQFK